ncbi:ketopantoate reductase PanE/ApbA C terminal-domain-containing protein [Zychaea mexicana]|uniref:ketopantoate reductase PanE/ApbA C terminal-domain-containing protein n=1 Tax=Zychaea mexicana TaxID=64656 RepID=UPI0022FF141B|nr:ketopantoate reductase PanE/ApbA C terminal-domain-containing protein [Zychaea mexicana]KAI9499632.1 ketopantoate reductase PanE/ApbA C terminal-domain-containing protein [Zychaea mexicana]
MRVHVLGAGSVGCFVASELRARQHNVTLILRSRSAVQEFRNRYQSAITFRRVDRPDPVILRGFDAVSIGDSSSLTEPVSALVVTTKSQHALAAVRSIKPHLSRSSSLVLLQNGMGVADELLGKLWPINGNLDDSKSDDEYAELLRPSIIVGVNKHATRRLEPFSVKHSSGWDGLNEGMSLGPMPGASNEIVQPLMQAFAECPGLNVALVQWPELRKRLMRKLVVNGSINAVAALLECTNESLLDNPYGLQLLRGVSKEASQVLTELNATEDELYDSVYNTLVVSGPYHCSTVQDVLAQRKTEIEYINGYLCRLGRERNVPVPLNEFLVKMVHAKECRIGAK